jgi:hypothetical protein
MIDIGPITEGAIAAIVPYLKKGLDSISGEAGKSLWSWTKSKFISRKSNKDLEALIANPGDVHFQNLVRKELEQIIAENPALVAELSELVSAANKETVQITGNQNLVFGNIDSNGPVIIGNNNAIFPK